jgi:hypothetical protein
MSSSSEGKAYLSGLLATVTVMTLMTVLYGLILDEGMRLYFVGPYRFNLTRRLYPMRRMVRRVGEVHRRVTN